jgi:hypothetical protein
MIQLLVKKQNKRISGFHIEGHSGYANRGEDIVCAAVSALAINCVNSIEEFAADDFQIETDDARGMIDFVIPEEVSEQAELLLKSFVLGVGKISETYGEQYISVINR